jgi:hypothetical protein
MYAGRHIWGERMMECILDGADKIVWSEIFLPETPLM